MRFPTDIKRLSPDTTTIKTIGKCEEVSQALLDAGGKYFKINDYLNMPVFELLDTCIKNGVDASFNFNKPIDPLLNEVKHIVDITYFKPSGKMYTSSSEEYTFSGNVEMFDIWEKVRKEIITGNGQGLCGSGVDGRTLTVLVGVPSHPDNHPYLIMPDGENS